MFCTNCGHEIPENARFCAHCGAPAVQPGQPPEQRPPKQNRTALWIGVAATAVVVLATAIVLPLILLRDRQGEGEAVTDTTRIASTTATTPKPATTQETAASTSTSSSTSTSTTAIPAGPPGDSPGDWLEMQVPDLDDPVWEAAVSEEAVLFYTQSGDVPRLHAYLFDSGTLVELPVQSPNLWSIDLEGLLAVWYEGNFDPDTGEPSDMHVYAFLLPNGPKAEVAGGENGHPFYPQVGGSWITWVEGEPWEESPDEYWTQQIFGVEVDSAGQPLYEPVVLVSSALGSVMGDAAWIYSLSASHLAWENAADHDGIQAGTYMMDLTSGELWHLGTGAWRPSLAEGIIVYWDDGVRYAYLEELKPSLLDPRGDFPAAAPTYVVYYRYTDSEDHPYEIIARGYSGNHEQILAYSSLPPWLSAPLSASPTHIAVVADDVLRLFEWQAESGGLHPRL